MLVGVRRASLLVLNPSVYPSYAALQSWLEEHACILSVATYGQQYVETLRDVVAPREVRAVPALSELRAVSPLRALWRIFTSVVNRYEFIAILCSGDEEARSGQTVYRILGEALLSDRIVLVGPTATTMWPGGRGGFDVKRFRELTALLSTVGLGLSMTIVVLAAIAVHEAVVKPRVRR
jgi:hypothetical protein